MGDRIRWGIIGAGWISSQFAAGLSVLSEADLVAVGSRTQESAEKFGARFNVPRRHGSYEALANDPEVDVVYIGTPHPMHKDNSLLCLEAGKAVLCEKPFTINATEAEQVIKLARSKKLFLMEAMWTRYIPLIVKVREMINEGVIGELQLFTADLGFRAEYDPQHRLFNPDLGGGALLDIGVYPISFASMLFGPPDRIIGLAQFGKTGVDEQMSVVLGHDRGQLATCYATFRTDSPIEAIIMGTKGRIRVHTPMFKPTTLTLSIRGRDEEVIKLPLVGNGYNYQAVEVMNCLRAGQLESEIMPLDETLQIMRTMDEIRAQWGLKYPME
jgi:predicted dehydrogenase